MVGSKCSCPSVPGVLCLPAPYQHRLENLGSHDGYLHGNLQFISIVLEAEPLTPFGVTSLHFRPDPRGTSEYPQESCFSPLVFLDLMFEPQSLLSLLTIHIRRYQSLDSKH